MTNTRRRHSIVVTRTAAGSTTRSSHRPLWRKMSPAFHQPNDVNFTRWLVRGCRQPAPCPSGIRPTTRSATGRLPSTSVLQLRTVRESGSRGRRPRLRAWPNPPARARPRSVRLPRRPLAPQWSWHRCRRSVTPVPVRSASLRQRRDDADAEPAAAHAVLVSSSMRPSLAWI
jgi:hypothetical protein